MPKSKVKKQRELFEGRKPKPTIESVSQVTPDLLYLPIEVDTLECIFGATDISKLLPPYRSIPKDFREGRNKWSTLVSTWFFCGLKDAVWKPVPGIDENKALRHLKAIMSSFEPKHEHKEAGVAYLLSLWFEDVTYSAADQMEK